MKSTIARRFLLCLLILSFFGCKIAYGASLKLVAFQYPPLVYEERGEITGIATQLVRSIFDEMGVDIEIEILPWARALQYLEHGQAGGVFTIFKNPEREGFLLYPGQPLIEQTITLYTRNDNPIAFTNPLAELASYRIGVTRAVSYGRRVDRVVGESLSNVTVVNDEESKFMLLAKGRVDVVVSSTGIADFYLKKLKLQGQISRIPLVIERVPSFLAFSKTPANRALADRFERALHALKRSGRYDDMVETYYQSTSAD